MLKPNIGHELRKLYLRWFFRLKYKRIIYALFGPFFTEPNERLDKALDEVCKIAASKNLKFYKPKIRMVTRGISVIDVRRRTGLVVGKTAGLAFGKELILVFAKYVDELSDMDLAILVAHEFGHIIDFQTKREGHPLFNSIWHLDRETFADAVAAYLYSKLMLVAVHNKCNFPINELAILNLNLNV